MFGDITRPPNSTYDRYERRRKRRPRGDPWRQETLDHYLARGGQVTQCRPAGPMTMALQYLRALCHDPCNKRVPGPAPAPPPEPRCHLCGATALFRRKKYYLCARCNNDPH